MVPSPDPAVPSPYPLAVRLLARSAENPDAVAVTDATASLTYAGLARRAGRVASALTQRGGSGPVAVRVDRSVASVAALAGVLWAARPLVPVDANEPTSRLAQMFDRAEPTVVLDVVGGAGSTLLGRPVVDAGPLVAPPPPGGRDTEVGDPWPPVPADLGAMCTLFFTSGSTGAPKAVVRTGHEGAVAWRLWDRPRLRGAWSDVAVFAPLHFAAGYLFALILPALGHRATLVDLAVTSPDGLVDRCGAGGVDCLALTPSLVHALTTMLDGRRLDGVRHVMTFGEPLDWSVVARIRGIAAPDVTVQSLYGASESLGMTLEHTIGPAVPLGHGRVPLGTPIDPTAVRLEPVEGADDRSEIVLVRDVVTRYHDDPDLSAERFGRDPDGTPFWRSGDLVRVDADGVWHSCGRRDDMVKVGGRLVEPAEVEAVLRQIPGVRAAAVVPQAMGDSRTRLVAHVETDATASPDGVRAALVRHLPGFLVPGVLVRHDRLPVTDRGKVDRAALRAAPVVPWRSADPTGAAPTSGAIEPLVAAVTAVAAVVLQDPGLGPDDDLWAAGFDSLAVLEIAAALGDAHGGSVDLDVFLEATTPRAVAATLAADGARRRDVPTCRGYGLGAGRAPLHLFAGAGASALQYRALLLELGDDQPVVVHEQAGLRRGARRDRSIAAHAARCAAEIRAQVPRGPVGICGHSYGGVVAIEVSALLERAGYTAHLALLDVVPLERSVPPAVGAVGRARRRFARPSVARARAVAQREVRRRRHGTRERFEWYLRRADRQLVGYRPTPVRGPVARFVAEASRHLVTDAPGSEPWIEVPGSHSSLVYPPHVTVLAAHLRAFFAALGPVGADR